MEFRTKPQLAVALLTRTLAAGMPADWVAGGEVYGQHFRLRGDAAIESTCYPVARGLRCTSAHAA